MDFCAAYVHNSLMSVHFLGHRRLVLAISAALLLVGALLGVRIVRHHMSAPPATSTTQQQVPAPQHHATTHETSKSRAVAIPGTHTIAITSGGLDRSYILHLPKGYDARKTYPVLMGFHGGFGSAQQFEASTGLDTQADMHNFIVIYGQGTSWGRIGAPVWNAGGCCGQAVNSQKNVDDVNYVRQILKDVDDHYWIDTRRVYATGMSNGAMLAHRLACEASDRIHGIAAVSGTIQITNCSPAQRMPILMMQGTNDPRVLYDGGTSSGPIQITSQPVLQIYREWAARNGCAVATPAVTTRVASASSDGKSVDQIQYPGCPTPTTLYRVNGGVHEWPGGNPTNNTLEQKTPPQAINASHTIVTFFGLDQ